MFNKTTKIIWHELEIVYNFIRLEVLTFFVWGSKQYWQFSWYALKWKFIHEKKKLKMEDGFCLLQV